MSAVILDDLLRDPARIASRCEQQEGLRELTLTALGALVLGSAAFGAVVGSFRGGLQIAFSATKLPLALLAALVVCVPAFHAVTLGFGGRSRFPAVAALTLCASARAALVLMALAPVLWLAVDRGLGYHASILLASVMYLTSGLAALGIVVRGLGGPLRGLAAGAACAALFLGVLGQTAWMLRPFFGRPAQQSVPFVRAREGTFADALATSRRSATGHYDRVERGDDR
jgi:hypothetical protein